MILSGQYSSPAVGLAIAALLATSAVLPGCSKAEQPAASAAAADVVAAADSGVQTVTGKAPASSGMYPSIVVLEPVGETSAVPAGAQPSMDQEQQTFIPSLMIVRTGAPVDFFNHDDVLHNVRVKDDETKESAFNVAIPIGEKFTHIFTRDGFYDVGCDIHPGMSAQIMSSSSAYTTLADPSGAFTIRNVPNGPYKAIAYAGAQKIEKEIDVSAASATVDLTTP